MSSLHKDLSKFRTCALRLEALLNGIQNAFDDRRRINTINFTLPQMDAIQKDQIQYALSLLQDMRSEFILTKQQQRESNNSHSNKDSFIHDEDDDEATLVQLTEQVQFYLNHVQSSIKDSIVEPKPKKIRLIDLVMMDDNQEDLIKAKAIPELSLNSKAFTSTTASTLPRIITSHQQQQPSSTVNDHTTTISTGIHDKSQPLPLPKKQKKLDYVIHPSTTTTTTTNMEPEVISHRLQQDIANMAQQLKTTSLNIHKSLQYQNVQLNEMESLAQESIDKTKNVSDKVQDHVKKGWKSIFGRWFIFFIIVGTWFFCFLVIRTIPKKRNNYQSYSSSSYNHHHEDRNKVKKSSTTTSTTTSKQDDFTNVQQTRSSSSSCSSPPNSHSTFKMEEEQSSSCSSPPSISRPTFHEEEITIHKKSSTTPLTYKHNDLPKHNSYTDIQITEMGNIEGVHIAMDEVYRRKEERYARNIQKAMAGGGAKEILTNKRKKDTDDNDVNNNNDEEEKEDGGQFIYITSRTFHENKKDTLNHEHQMESESVDKTHDHHGRDVHGIEYDIYNQQGEYHEFHVDSEWDMYSDGQEFDNEDEYVSDGDDEEWMDENDQKNSWITENEDES